MKPGCTVFTNGLKVKVDIGAGVFLQRRHITDELVRFGSTVNWTLRCGRERYSHETGTTKWAIIRSFIVQLISCKEIERSTGFQGYLVSSGHCKGQHISRHGRKSLEGHNGSKKGLNFG